MILGITPFDIIAIVVLLLLIILVPILLKMRVTSSIAKYTFELEEMVKKSKKTLIDICIEKGSPDKDPDAAIENFMEFFIVPPVDLDPAGIMRKFERILEMGEDRFEHMTEIIAPHADNEWKSNINMTLKATLGINGVAKMVRHNLELSRKTGNLQILLMLQMSLPMIMRIVRAQYEGTHAFSEGKPVGDSLGPLVAGIFMKDISKEDLKVIEDLVIGETEIEGRNVVIVRADGPGAKLGKIGKTVTSIMEKENIKRLITVDASQKLEGEKTGAVAEGVGVVIGGPGVDKWIIEEEMIKKDLQIDAVIVKMSPEEAILQMTEEIRGSSEEALKVVKNLILQSKAGTRVIVVGVGNSCGIPNIVKDISEINIKEHIKT